MALGAMAPCIANAITFNAHRHGIKPNDVRVSVSTDVNPDAHFERRGPEAHAACMQNLRADIRVKAENITPVKIEVVKKLAEHPPVDGLVSQADPIANGVAT